MANFIPVLDFGGGDDLLVVFDTPPEGDPQNEQIGTEREQVRSVGGQLFTTDFYDYTNFTLRFILQSNSVALKLKQLFKDYALKGETFTYYPHSDDVNLSFEVELSNEDIVFNRDHPDGRGGFLWSFEFTLISVNKTAPRIVRGTVVNTPTPVRPEPVRNLLALNVLETSATIQWDAPTSFGTSTLKHYKISDGTREFTTSNTSFNLTGLTASTAYIVTVTAVNLEDLESTPENVNFTTNASIPPLSVPRNVAARATGQNSIFIAWLPPTNNGGKAITGYDVERVVSGTNPSTSTTDLYHTDQNLQPDTSYTYRVRAKNADGVGPWSANVSARTEAVPPPMVPGAPVLNTLGLATENLGIRVPFDWPTTNAQNITQIKIYYHTSLDSTVRTKTVDIDAGVSKTGSYRVFTGDDIIPEDRPQPVIFFIRITAINADGESEKSNFKNITLDRTHILTIDGTRINTDGNYEFTSNYGNSDNVNFYNQIQLNNSRTNTNADRAWEGEGAFPSYRLPGGNVAEILAIQPSLTRQDEMAVSMRVWPHPSGTTNLYRLFLLKRIGLVWYLHKEIKLTGAVYALSAYKTASGYTRYFYVVYRSNVVNFTQADFVTIDKFRWLDHGDTRHVGCCYAQDGANHIMYILDWYSDNIYAYNILTGARISSKDIPLPNFLYPFSLWTNSKFVWMLGATEFARYRTRRNKVYCYNLSTKSRESSRDFVLDSRSVSDRYANLVEFAGLCVRNNGFIVSKTMRGRAISPEQNFSMLRWAL